MPQEMTLECRGKRPLTVRLGSDICSVKEDWFRGRISITQISFSEGLGVTSIEDWAFAGCTGLTKINLPKGLTSIGDMAFYGCTGLMQISLPEGLTSIGSEAFADCTGLTQINLPEGLTSIGDRAFTGCTGLTHMILPDQFCTDAEKVRLGIPEAVHCIGYGEIQRFINDLNIEGAYSADIQALLYRLSRDRTFHPDELKGLKDCSFNDVMKAIRYRHSQQQDADDIRGLMKGLLGASRIDQTVEIDQLMKLDFVKIVNLVAKAHLPSTLLSYMTVKDMMRYSQSERGGSALLSLKRIPERKQAKKTTHIWDRLLSTYHLKLCSFLGLTYGGICLGSSFGGLLFAGAASLMLVELLDSHIRALRAVAQDHPLLDHYEEDPMGIWIKIIFKNITTIIANITWRAANEGMKQSSQSKMKHDFRYFGLIFGAAAASSLAIAYTPIIAPMLRVATAVLPVFCANSVSHCQGQKPGSGLKR